jgi:hypothetical protein
MEVRQLQVHQGAKVAYLGKKFVAPAQYILFSGVSGEMKHWEPIGTYFAESIDLYPIETFRDEAFLVNDATDDVARLLKLVSIDLGSVNLDTALILMERVDQESFRLEVVLCASEGERRRVIRYRPGDAKAIGDLLKHSAEMTRAIIAQF